MNLTLIAWPITLFTKMGLGLFISSLRTLVPGGSFLSLLRIVVIKILNLDAGLPTCLGPGENEHTIFRAGCGEIGRVYAYCGTSGSVGLTEKRPALLENSV
jgi:hypothetical protein